MLPVFELVATITVHKSLHASLVQTRKLVSVKGFSVSFCSKVYLAAVDIISNTPVINNNNNNFKNPQGLSPRTVSKNELSLLP